VTLTRLHRPEEARTALEESVVLTHEARQPLLEAHALAALGQVHREEGTLDRAVQCFEQSREIRRAVGDRIGEGWMLHHLAEVKIALEEPAAARDAAASAARIAAESGDADLIAACGSVPPAH
jgi:tetratricopeptide (TPR) repeat protein